MRVLLVERGGVGAEATGVNAGTLSLQIKRVAPDALRAARSRVVGERRRRGRLPPHRRLHARVQCARSGVARRADEAEDRGGCADRVRVAVDRSHARAGLVRPYRRGVLIARQDGHADSTRSGVYLRDLLRASAVSSCASTRRSRASTPATTASRVRSRGHGAARPPSPARQRRVDAERSRPCSGSSCRSRFA